MVAKYGSRFGFGITFRCANVSLRRNKPLRGVLSRNDEPDIVCETMKDQGDD